MPSGIEEPRKRMLTPAWEEARERVTAEESHRHTLYPVMVRLIENGAESLARLQLLFEQREESSRTDSRVSHLLQFIDEDLTDVFRDVVAGAATLVPGPDWLEHADPPEAQSHVRLLVRYLAVASSAAEHPEVPLEVRRVFSEVAARLAGWGEELEHVMRGIAESEVNPATEAR